MRYRNALTALALGCVAAAPPAARLGSTERTQTPPLQAPIDRVVVYSNRAQVVRTTTIRLKKGANVFRFERLPPSVLDESVRVSATGARVLRAEVSTIETEGVAIAAVQAQLDDMEALRRQRRVLIDAQRIESTSLELLQSLQPAAFVPEQDRNGRALAAVSPAAWLATSKFFQKRAETARRQLATLEQRRRPLDTKIDELRRKLARVRLSGDARRYTEVFAVVESAVAKSSVLSLAYDIAGPSWQPVYDLHYDPSGGRLAVYTGAIVRQQTGEDWTDARLTFSTGVPDKNIAVPELLTWTLGEERDFMPQVRPARRPPPPAVMAPPEPLLDGPSEALLALRDQYAAAMQSAPGAKVKTPVPPPAPRPTRESGRSVRRKPAPKSRTRTTERYAEAVERVTPASGDDVEELRIEGSISSWRSKRRRRGPSLTTRAFALSQAVAPDRLAGLARSTPAVMTGGREFLYAAPTRTAIPSDGQPIKVAVAVERFDTEGFHESTPGVSTTAYLRARLTNRSTRPMLAGPTNIFVGGRFIGQGKVKTTAPQKQIEFGLGADESIKLVRKVMPSTREEGVFSKHSVTKYRVVIQAANYHRRPVRLEVLEPIPKSKKDDIEIKVLSMNPKPTKGPDASGIVRFQLDLTAGATRTIEIVYEIDRPADFELRQY